MHIGVVTSCVSRNAGGLFHSVRRLSQSTRDAGADVSVFSIRDEFTSADLSAWAPIEPHVYEPRGPARLAWSTDLGRALQSFTPREAIVHLHGIWQYASLATLRWHRATGGPTMIAPRGMLDPWAVQNSPWRKRVVGFLYEHANLRSARCMHALTDIERAGFRAFGLKNPVAVVPNGIDIPSPTELEQPADPAMPNEWKDKRILLFLARVHPKKGIPMLLEAWARLGRERADWRLAIAGPDEIGHQAQIEDQIRQLGLSQEVALVGPQFGAAKSAWLRRADAFVLPSHSEGFPMAVLEAMAYRLPVLMTDACNFPEAAQADVAWAVPPRVDAIAIKLGELLSMSTDDARQRGTRARAFIEQGYSWNSIALQMIAVYRWMLGGGTAPDAVRND